MNEFENITTELSKIKKENPFRVPDHYFDDFQARLQTKLDAENSATQKPMHRILQYAKPILGLAAGFALIFSLVYWPLKSNFSKELANNSMNKNETEIIDMEYINMVEGIDESSFYALLEEPMHAATLSDEDIASYIQTNSSEYEIYSESQK